MQRRTVLVLIGAIALVAVVVVGLTQTKTETATQKDSAFSLPEAQRLLAGSPPALAALHADGSKLLPGTKKTVRSTLDGLKGHPVVLNKWASWCGPCRAEFPILQRSSVAFGKKVAFVGLDSGDNTENARNFLSRFPVAYPSFIDGNHRIATSLGTGSNFPVTIFYDSRGRQRYLHQGPYLSQAKLAQDIRRYALQ